MKKVKNKFINNFNYKYLKYLINNINKMTYSIKI